MNCREGLMLRSSGAARRVLQIRKNPSTFRRLKALYAGLRKVTFFKRLANRVDATPLLTSAAVFTGYSCRRLQRQNLPSVIPSEYAGPTRTKESLTLLNNLRCLGLTRYDKICCRQRRRQLQQLLDKAK